MEARNKFIFTC